jgi:proton-translocating NADH-quinone oxidoreductase chain L
MFLLLIVGLPLLGYILPLTLGRLVSWKKLSTIIIGAMGALVLYLAASFPQISDGDVYSASIGSWVRSGLMEINWNFSVDTLTYTMLIVVLSVSTLVHLYSTEYMSEDPHTGRFISYLSLFTFFMLLLITADNLVNLFLGWEGVGLCSYLLISFWYTRVPANKAAIKAMIVNRIADLAFTLGMLATFYSFQTTDFSVLFGLAPFFVDSSVLFLGLTVSPITLVTLLLFLGAMGKSAQIGLHTWLPDAMEGPTPVSALIHAATMVTAGVFLLIRASSLYELSSSVRFFITVAGAATAFMAATSGLLQNDLKKVIAYSTCSQLGYMVFACGLSSYALSLFHLTNHAFFKALLFLSAGAVIHSVSNEQDMRKLGRLIQLLPYTYVMFVTGSLALIGFPFLSGFYSKDLILEIAAGSITVGGIFAYWLGLVTAMLTSFYSFRLLSLVFVASSRSPRTYLVQLHALSPRMAFSLAALTLGSIFFGYIWKELFVGFGTDFWGNVIIQHSSVSQLNGEFYLESSKHLPLLGSICASVLLFITESWTALGFYSFTGAGVLLTTNLTFAGARFLTSKWGFDVVYNLCVNTPLMKLAYRLFALIDKGALEAFGPTGGSTVISKMSRQLLTLQTGRVYDYMAIILAGVSFFLLVVAHIYIPF